jgi:hypothetical protein
MAKVTDPLAAVEVLKDELTALALLGFSQIGILEDHRGWRCVHPHAAVRMEYLMDAERHGNHFPRVVESLRAGAVQAAEMTRALLARPDATPEQRETLADTLRALEQMLPTIVLPSAPEIE